jgi:hypothetical protein
MLDSAPASAARLCPACGCASHAKALRDNEPSQNGFNRRGGKDSQLR